MSRSQRPSLILLPSPPEPSTRTSLNAAYGPSLSAALIKLKSPSHSSTLIIAVACPVLRGSTESKSLHWPSLQSLLAGLYSILAVTCAKHSIGTDSNGGSHSVDARVILIDHDRRVTSPGAERRRGHTIVYDLATFATSSQPWNFIFHTNSEAGQGLLSAYLSLTEGRQTILQDQLVVVDAGITMHIQSLIGPSSGDSPSSYPVVCLGGTFDHLHPGHKLLLSAAALLLKVPEREAVQPATFIIGITGDEMLRNKKFAEYVQSWDERARTVIEFLSTILQLPTKDGRAPSTPAIRESPGVYITSFRESTISVECVEIQDAFGPTITREAIDALVVSGESRSGGQAVNDKRKERGWTPLKVYEVDVLDANDIADEASKTENFAAKISSTAIREQKARANGK